MPDATGQALSAFTFASSSTTTSVTTSSTATPTADAATLSSSGSPSPASHTASTSAGPSQSLSSSPNSTKNPSPNHLSAGGIAGFAIACAVVGAAFALALMWFLQRSQSRSSSKHHKPHLGRTHKSLRHEKDEEKIIDHSAITSLGTQPKVDVDAFLPQQADDATVKQKLLLLFDQIELHVDNFYNEDGQHLTSEQQSDISRYAKADLPMPLVSILETSHRRTTVLKHCLAYHAVHLVSPSNQTDCLLPYEVSSTLAYSEAHPDAFRRNPGEWRTMLNSRSKLTILCRPSCRPVPLAHAHCISAA